MGLVYLGQNQGTDGMLWVDDTAVINEIRNPVNSDPFLKYVIHKWASKAKVPLFKKKTLDIGDINQEGLGDCWYLAALAAIVNHPQGSALIKKTMVDLGNGRVVVRFFDGDYMPVYISTEKSVIWYLGPGKVHASRSNRTGLWPLMLEKAACCMDKASDFKNCDPDNPRYSNIEGGNSHHAFRMLLGCMVDSINISGKNKIGANNAAQMMNLLFTDAMAWMGMKTITQEHRDAVKNVLGSNVTVERWQQQFKKLFNSNSILLGDKYKVGSQMRRLEFQQLMSSPGITGLDAKLGLALASFAQMNQIFSKGIGSGQYSWGAIDVFNTIRANLASKRPICMGTEKNIGISEGRGKSANESKVKGMVGGHAYAILDAFEENVLSRRKYIKVANPWGGYGRKYSETYSNMTLTPVEQKSGVSWLELSDFCDLASSLYVCKQNPADILGYL